MEEQYERFCEALKADCSRSCEDCPIHEECYDLSENLPSTEYFNPEYSCEMLLFRYLMTGEKPKIKGM